MAYLFKYSHLRRPLHTPKAVFAFVLSFFRIFNPDLLTPALFIDPIRPTPSCLSDNGALLTDGSNSFEKALSEWEHAIEEKYSKVIYHFPLSFSMAFEGDIETKNRKSDKVFEKGTNGIKKITLSFFPLNGSLNFYFVWTRPFGAPLEL